jgi:hypothetical protein
VLFRHLSPLPPSCISWRACLFLNKKTSIFFSNLLARARLRPNGGGGKKMQGRATVNGSATGVYWILGEGDIRLLFC